MEGERAKSLSLVNILNILIPTDYHVNIDESILFFKKVTNAYR